MFGVDLSSQYMGFVGCRTWELLWATKHRIGSVECTSKASLPTSWQMPAKPGSGSGLRYMHQADGL